MGSTPRTKFKAWSIEVMEDMVATEIDYLKHNIYNGSINIPIEIIDAESRFSVNKCISDNKEKYADKVAWLNSLQQ